MLGTVLGTASGGNLLPGQGHPRNAGTNHKSPICPSQVPLPLRLPFHLIAKWKEGKVHRLWTLLGFCPNRRGFLFASVDRERSPRHCVMRAA